MADIVYGYVRVSSTKQEDGFGPEIQADAIVKYCAEKNLPAPIIVNETETGTILEREGLNSIYDRAKKHIADGHKPHCVLYRMDRLARILVYIEKKIAEAHLIGLRLHSCAAGEAQFFDPDMAHDPVTKMIRHILASVVEYERDVITMRMDKGVRRLASKGGYTGGGVPFGYKLVDHDLVIEPDLADAVREVLAYSDTGISLRDIAKQMSTKYPIANWNHNIVDRVIKNRRLYEEGLYVGRYGDEVVRPELRML